MSSPVWYWHRLRAMSLPELGAHGRRKLCQLSDSVRGARRFAHVREIGPGAYFPKLPSPESAPSALRTVLRKDLADILAGRWIAFGYLTLELDDPPLWHKDYLAGVDMATTRRALKLHHRLEGAADIKLIWEPSRWSSLVRLAQGAYLLNDQAAASACLRWLEDWAETNPPYCGWHWTSGLESGLRLIQFAWMDALLSGMASPASNARQVELSLSATLARIRAKVLLPHLWFTWRDRSFGSSANNHLLGELAGLIVALARWPALSRWAVSLDILQPLWERQVLAQFALDGGNREQALNYHLFGWEFCWQARLALLAAGRRISPEVDDRLRAAASFFTSVQVEDNAWDYGDSDNACVTPFFIAWQNATQEWHTWLRQPGASPGLSYWLGEPPKRLDPPSVSSGAKGWRVYPETGLAIYRDADWFLRWDLSPLGYLSTAGHGHCDALHLSMWYRGQPLVIDPGTAAYHSDRAVRDYLSSWSAHNGPHLARASIPQRMGTFLWSNHHQKPTWTRLSDHAMQGELRLPEGRVRRTITRLQQENGWQIEDAFEPLDSGAPEVEVFWQFAPEVQLTGTAPRVFLADLGQARVRIEVSEEWVEAHGELPKPAGADGVRLAGTCSPLFRRILQAPFLALRGAVPSAGTRRTSFVVDR